MRDPTVMNCSKSSVQGSHPGLKTDPNILPDLPDKIDISSTTNLTKESLGKSEGPGTCPRVSSGAVKLRDPRPGTCIRHIPIKWTSQIPKKIGRIFHTRAASPSFASLDARIPPSWVPDISLATKAGEALCRDPGGLQEHDDTIQVPLG